MPASYSPQVHARSVKSALTNALRSLEPLCNDDAGDVCRQADAVFSDLHYAVEALKRVREAAQAKAEMKPARVLERIS